MFRKSTLFALAAVATLGSAMVSVDSASAAAGIRNTGRINVGRVNVTRVNLRIPNRPGPHLHPRLPHPHWHVFWRHRHPIWIGTRPAVYGAVAPVVGSTNRCTCLTKEYTPEGAVLFKDICTNEAAINPPPAPVQTGYAPMPTGPQAQ